MINRIIPTLCASFLVPIVMFTWLQSLAFADNDSSLPGETLSAAQTQEALEVSSADESQTAPDIEFEAIHPDFGKVLSGQNPTIDFSFKNAGAQTLVIKKVKGG